MRDAQSSSWRGFRQGWDKAYALNNIQTRTAQELMHDRLGEAGCIVFDPNRLPGLVEVQLPDAVHLADPTQGHYRRLTRRRSVAVHHIKLRHKKILAASVRRRVW